MSPSGQSEFEDGSTAPWRNIYMASNIYLPPNSDPPELLP